MVNDCGHGLINYIDTKAKCSHLKKWTSKKKGSKGTLRQVLYTGDTVSHVGIFNPAL
jgi:hypothetical protein